jgi:hypothetical protein
MGISEIDGFHFAYTRQTLLAAYYQTPTYFPYRCIPLESSSNSQVPNQTKNSEAKQNGA